VSGSYYYPTQGNTPDRTYYPSGLKTQLVLVTPPTVEPVSVPLAKQWAVIEDTCDDNVIAGLITEARETVESWISRALITQSWKLTLDAFPYEIELRLPPIQSVDSINYIDVNGVEQLLDPSQYQTDLTTEPARIRPAYNMVWPIFRIGIVNPIWVNFTAGFGNAGSSVPQKINQAIIRLVALRYRNREPMTIGADPQAAEADIRRQVMSASWGAYV
jgi:uncharacterized phiE125 gp8 family phage protein